MSDARSARALAALVFGAGPGSPAATVKQLDQASAGAAIGSFFAVVLLFAPAVVLLGAVAPFAIRLALTDVASGGAVAGRFYALSPPGPRPGTLGPAPPRL